jgi:hypothetical protein
MSKRRKNPEDNIGKGKLRCQICSRPTRDHSIGRCPEADDDPDLFKGPARLRGRRRKQDSERMA